MNRFVKHLLPLCMLAVMAAPVHAGTEAASDCDVATPAKGAINQYTEKTVVTLSQANDCVSEVMVKLKEIADRFAKRACEDENEEPNLPQEPEEPQAPEEPNPEEPENPDIDEPGESEQPNPEEPQEPEEPEAEEGPEEPETPVEPERPVWPGRPQPPTEPSLPEEPQQPEEPQEPEQPSVEEPQLPSSVSAYAKQVVTLVNQERAAAGLGSLTLNTELSQVATVKAEDMRDRNYFSHTSPTYGSPFDMMKQFGISYKAAGENIAKGQKTPESVMNSWMNSAGHKANILSTSYTEIGVGYVTDSNGTTYWVQMFIRP